MEHEKTDVVTIDNNINVNEEVKTGTEAEVAKTEETKVEGAVEAKKEIMIPKERFDEVNGKYKEISTQVKEMKKANEELQRTLEEMKKSSEQETSLVKDTADKLKEQVQTYETVMSELVQTKLESVPEDLRELVPEGLTVEQKLAWINKAESKGLFKKQPAQVVVGQPLNHSSEQNQAERVKKMNPLQALASYYAQK